MILIGVRPAFLAIPGPHRAPLCKAGDKLMSAFEIGVMAPWRYGSFGDGGVCMSPSRLFFALSWVSGRSKDRRFWRPGCWGWPPMTRLQTIFSGPFRFLCSWGLSSPKPVSVGMPSMPPILSSAKSKPVWVSDGCCKCHLRGGDRDIDCLGCDFHQDCGTRDAPTWL